ncbi:unnamed protein product [Brugia pahangi]|uniref:Protein kinase domain-containing protein n=1 Tax=Brugia pahangi TaxID=6280 RepID=A0A0N4TU03_BRUPA|nr:unnamed protein product [Brugia pahangi]
MVHGDIPFYYDEDIVCRGPSSILGCKNLIGDCLKYSADERCDLEYRWNHPWLFVGETSLPLSISELDLDRYNADERCDLEYRWNHPWLFVGETSLPLSISELDLDRYKLGSVLAKLVTHAEQHPA